MQITLHIAGMTCGGCIASVQKLLQAQPGVSTAQVDLTSNSAVITLDPAQTSREQLVKQIEGAGYDVVG